MDLFDTHCHIQSIGGLPTGERSTRDSWAKNPDLTPRTVLDAAHQNGVKQMVVVGCDLDDSRLAVSFAQDHAGDGVWASIGLHPHEAQHYAGKPDLQAKFAELAADKTVVAIGECGFDFYYYHSPKEAQIETLHFQFKLAQQHNLPMIFHVREAFDDFWPIFDQYPGTRGVLHSFTDSVANMQQAIDRGLYIGVNGIATFAKIEEQRAMYKAIPLEHLLLETDAPFLTPVPFRGSINEPKHVAIIADFVADLRGDNLENLSAVTTSNARNLFGV